MSYIATTLLFALKTLTGLDDFEVHELLQILHFYSVTLKFIFTTSYNFPMETNSIIPGVAQFLLWLIASDV